MKHLKTALFAALIVVLCGCSGSNLVGKYKADIKVPPGKESDPGIAFAKGMADSITLELKADKTFLLTMMFPIEGTYNVSGSTVTLTPTKVMGQPADSSGKSKPMSFNIENGGTRLVAVDNKDSGGGEMAFVRQ